MSTHVLARIGMLALLTAGLPTVAQADPGGQIFEVADVAEQVLPAVVSIRTVQEMPEIDLEDVPFFLRPYLEDGRGMEPREGAGSGW